MKVRFGELPVGSCFMHGRSALRKKVGDEKTATVRGNGKVSTRKMKGNPEVEPSPCPLKYLGVGLRRHPDAVVEIGDGNIVERRTRKTKKEAL